MIDQNRVRQVNTTSFSQGPIVYWMSRDQRAHDNWALLYALQLAQEKNESVAVVFSLRTSFPYATERLVDFMLSGLAEVAQTLSGYAIPFYFLLGDPVEQIETFVNKYDVGAVISDFSPLLYNRVWKEQLGQKLTIPFYEVDTHNVVPCWKASPKQEFAAYTFRPKIHSVLTHYLTEFPQLTKQKNLWKEKMSLPDWEKISAQIAVDRSVKKVAWLKPGEKAAQKKLTEFIEEKLVHYSSLRNDPSQDMISGLSPYIHFGHIASQRIALTVREEKHTESVDAFLEELIVRKELADNFCFYNKNYMNSKGFPDWAKKTLSEHAEDKREFSYTKKELEEGKTHDVLWNAAQLEMVKRGKMHGYLRMYWAKKIFEWVPNVDKALAIAQELNDTCFLDGRDPNGYVGIAWCMGGVHDRAWFEREIFGKIRYMSYNSQRKKFDSTKYISWVNSL